MKIPIIEPESTAIQEAWRVCAGAEKAWVIKQPLFVTTENILIVKTMELK